MGDDTFRSVGPDLLALSRTGHQIQTGMTADRVSRVSGRRRM